MTSPTEPAALHVQLHEQEQHNALEERIAGLMGTIEAACRELDQLREDTTSHLTSYHAPEAPFELEAHAGWQAMAQRQDELARELAELRAGEVTAAPAAVEAAAEAAADAAVAGVTETAATAAEPVDVVIDAPAVVEKKVERSRGYMGRLHGRRG